MLYMFLKVTLDVITTGRQFPLIVRVLSTYSHCLATGALGARARERAHTHFIIRWKSHVKPQYIGYHVSVFPNEPHE